MCVSGGTYQAHGVKDLEKEDLEGLDRLALAEIVGAVLGEPGGCVFGSETMSDVGLKLERDLVRGEAVSGPGR